MRILVDMDGILADLLERWLQVYNDDHGDTVTKDDITTWSVHDHVKIGHRVYDYLKLPRFFAELNPLPGAVVGFRQMQALGHEVLVCTASGGGTSASCKQDWCARHLGINRRDVIVTHHKTIIEADVLIDDKGRTVADWAKRGKTAITIAYPHNKGVAKHCALYAEDYRDTARAWAEIVDWVADRSLDPRTPSYGVGQ